MLAGAAAVFAASQGLVVGMAPATQVRRETATRAFTARRAIATGMTIMRFAARALLTLVLPLCLFSCRSA